MEYDLTKTLDEWQVTENIYEKLWTEKHTNGVPLKQHVANLLDEAEKKRWLLWNCNDTSVVAACCISCSDTARVKLNIEKFYTMFIKDKSLLVIKNHVNKYCCKILCMVLFLFSDYAIPLSCAKPTGRRLSDRGRAKFRFGIYSGMHTLCNNAGQRGGNGLLQYMHAVTSGWRLCKYGVSWLRLVNEYQ